MNNSSNIRLGLINSMLRTVGSSRLSGEDTDHPDYITANEVLEEILEDFLSKPLWFNQSVQTLRRSTDGRVAVPSNTLSCDPINGANYVVRDRYLFDVDKRTYELPNDVECWIHAEVELSDMPKEAIKFIRCAARYKFYTDEDGGGVKMQVYGQEAYEADKMLNVVNIARMDINWFSSGSARSFFTPRPSGYQHIGGFAGTSNRNINLTNIR